MRMSLIVIALLSLATIASAQTVIRTVQFTASLDHSVTMADGTAIVTGYELEITKTGSAPLPVIAMGKPTPGANQLITIAGGVTIPTTLTAGDYTGKVYAVGPGGRTASAASDPFSIPPAPRASGKPVLAP